MQQRFELSGASAKPVLGICALLDFYIIFNSLQSWTHVSNYTLPTTTVQALIPQIFPDPTAEIQGTWG